MKYFRSQSSLRSRRRKGYGPRGIFLGILGGGCAARFSKILTLFQTKKLSFSTPVFRPGVGEIKILLLRLERQQKDFLKSTSNSHITLSFLFIWN